MDAQAVRADADRQLAERLATEPLIQRAAAERAAFEQDHNVGIRRSLLATALRLTREIVPDRFELVDRCRTRLGVTEEVELYVYPSPEFNAGMPPREGNRAFVMISSSLYEALDLEELAYVMGHELGHHIYDHHAIPLEVLGNPELPVPARLALELRAWQRYAEISADRAGMLCANGLQPAARALFKLSSGLSSAPDEARINAFLRQAEELYREVEQSEQPFHHQDWLASHPFSPVRLKAAAAFAKSQAFDPSGTPLPEVDAGLHDLMSLMEASYIDMDTVEAEHMRRVLFAGGVLVAVASGAIEEAEFDALSTLLGRHMPQSVSPEALRADLPRRIEAAKQHVSPGRRAQVVRDLAVVARSDGHVDPAEQAQIVAIAEAMGVSRAVVDQALHGTVHLD